MDNRRSEPSNMDTRAQASDLRKRKIFSHDTTRSAPRFQDFYARGLHKTPGMRHDGE